MSAFGSICSILSTKLHLKGLTNPFEKCTFYTFSSKPTSPTCKRRLLPWIEKQTENLLPFYRSVILRYHHYKE